MKLIVLGSSSTSNGYLLRSSTGEVLLLECGYKLIEVKKKLNFDLSGIVGGIVSHEHQDHSKYIEQYLSAGIEIRLSAGTNSALKYKSKTYPILCESKIPFMMGRFKILPFNTEHDAAEPLGFIINHPESGNIVFLTDSYYSKFKFKNINHYMVESNYCDDIVMRNIESGKLSLAMLSRLNESHMSIKTCKQLLEANDLSQVKNIVLIHLSSGNSNAKDFHKQVTELTGKKVTVADKNMEIDFNLKTF